MLGDGGETAGRWDHSETEDIGVLVIYNASLSWSVFGLEGGDTNLMGLGGGSVWDLIGGCMVPPLWGM